MCSFWLKVCLQTLTGTMVQSDNYDRRYERWTWKDVLYPHRDIKKRHKILPPPRLRDTDTPGKPLLSSS